MRNRRQRPGRVVLDTIVGLKPIDMGDYLQAIGYLVRYRNYGGRIKTASARCYYSPSRTASRRRGISPGEPELHVREAILSLSWPSTEKTSG
ncbi:MAG: hypothetical protein GX216_01690 [Methanomicrobiales archaeon]|jgi:hypothetical protein|nr:hypothetical protein [Methanomicrobiales archaeon]